MKRIIIISIVLIFSLFTLGTGVTSYKLLSITSDLRYLINMHEISAIRQALNLSAQEVRNYIYAPGHVFAEHLDQVVAAAHKLTMSAERCSTCHHRSEVAAEITKTGQLINTFEERLSFFITTVGNEKRQQKIQHDIAEMSDRIVKQIEEMVSRAGMVIQHRTQQQIDNIYRTYKFLVLILMVTFLLAFFVARFLTRQITRPIDALLFGARQIAEGKEGIKVNYRTGTEFGELIKSFNEMSEALVNRQARIQQYLDGLNRLNSLAISLHAARDMKDLLHSMGSCVIRLLGVEQQGIILPNEKNNGFLLYLTDARRPQIGTTPLALNKDQVLRVYQANEGQTIIDNSLAEKDWPFGVKADGAKPHNMLIGWLVKKNGLQGALIAVSKDGGFQKEDADILGILANNITVARENIGLYKDLELKMAELKRTQRQLVEAEKLTAIGTLAGGVAHDFNNILCGIIGHIALLKRSKKTGDPDVEVLATVEKAGLRAASLTKQLLTFARQDIGQDRLVALNDGVTSVIGLFKTMVSKFITIELALEPDLPKVLGDSGQLEQVIMNLCVNARDAMPNGGRLIVRTAPVTLDEEFCANQPEAGPGEHVQLLVSDNGTGIEEKILSRIFEPFFTTKEIGKGTGLGLAMVYGIVKRHNGFCQVTSKVGQGTTFTVHIPAASGEESEGPSATEVELQGEGTILIVDDEVIVHTMLREFLEDGGYRTMVALNGEEAIKVLTEHCREVDLVILDMNMPVMDGKEAFVRMKEIKPELKVIISSGYTLNETSREILAQGAHGFIQKPFCLEDLTKVIQKAMNQE